MYKYNPAKHHRRSIRLPGYDYSQSGAYFVTVCVKEHDCIFGDVVDGKMRLNEYGKIAEAIWRNIPNVRKNVSLDEFIIMPNHVHGIMLLHGMETAGMTDLNKRDHGGTGGIGTGHDGIDCGGIGGVGIGVGATELVAPTSVSDTIIPTAMHVTPATVPVCPAGPKSGSIGAIIGQYKSVVTKQINNMRLTPGAWVWQRGYYEHVIRTDDDMSRIRAYIHDNPANWTQDKNHV